MKTDRITVYESLGSRARKYNTSIEFFEQEHIRHISDSQIIFRIVPLDWGGKIYSCKKLSENVYMGTLPLNIPPGDYYVNWEESTEDKLIFNL